MKAYTGVGSRETPADIRRLMFNVAMRLAVQGWTLRSGRAPGADQAFEAGCFDVAGAKTIFLPWPGYEERFGREHGGDINTISRPAPRAIVIASQFHPAWERCSSSARQLHARNVHQVIGPDLDAPAPSRFLVCWTPNGAGGGGTGQAIRIAKHYGVPVFDLGRADDLDRITSWIEG